MKNFAEVAFLDELDSGNVKNFDPIRFEFIQSLSSRLSRSQSNGNVELDEKIKVNTIRYLADLKLARTQAQASLDVIGADFPQQLDVAKLLFEHYKFTQLERLCKKLGRQKNSIDQLGELHRLNLDINQKKAHFEKSEASDSIEDLLAKQNRIARPQINDADRIDTDGSGEQLELTSMKYYRKSLKHFDVDKIIARAINEGPENPGPLNPQMLAIRSLTHLRDLSPQYLRRFTGYIETLLWLEKNSNKLAKSNKPS
jgi:hypothetical protein